MIAYFQQNYDYCEIIKQLIESPENQKLKAEGKTYITDIKYQNPYPLIPVRFVINTQSVQVKHLI